MIPNITKTSAGSMLFKGKIEFKHEPWRTCKGKLVSHIIENEYHYQKNKGVEGMVITLNQLKPGEVGVVARVTGNGSIKSRIIDMGIVAGSKIYVQKYAPLGDPMEIKVKNFNLSLRKAEAAIIEVEVD